MKTVVVPTKGKGSWLNHYRDTAQTWYKLKSVSFAHTAVCPQLLPMGAPGTSLLWFISTLLSESPVHCCSCLRLRGSLIQHQVVFQPWVRYCTFHEQLQPQPYSESLQEGGEPFCFWQA